MYNYVSRKYGILNGWNNYKSKILIRTMFTNILEMKKLENCEMKLKIRFSNGKFEKPKIWKIEKWIYIKIERFFFWEIKYLRNRKLEEWKST